MNRHQRRIEKQGTRVVQGRLQPVEEAFAEALRHHRAGRVNEAIGSFREALALRPDLAEIHYNLGNALKQQGCLDEAAACFRSAIGIKPDFREAHNNLGTILREMRHWNEAAACFRTALDIDPERAEAHNNLGNALRDQGLLDEAIACFRKAIELSPEFPGAHNNLGIAFDHQGRLEEAVVCYGKAIALDPVFSNAHDNLGNALKNQGHLDEAVVCFRRSLDLKADSAVTHNNLGAVLLEQECLDEAILHLGNALRLKPEFPEAHNNMGTAMMEQGRLEQAIGCFRTALDLRPDFADVHINLGTAFKDLEQLDEAETCCRRALHLKPDSPAAHNNIGNLFNQKRRLDDAVACFRTALDLRPDFPEAHFNLAMVLLSRGDMAVGWEEYEWRWKTPYMIKDDRDFAQPQWHGEAATGRVLLIHAEQGFGDTLQFCRYATLAAGHGLRVVLEVQQPLVRLLRGLPGVERVVARGEALPDFDLHCPMLSLPRALGTRLDTIPAAASYVQADPSAVAAWCTRLAAMDRPGLRVGLVWAGNPRRHSPALAAVDRRRSIAPDRLAPLFELSGLHLFSLQKDGPAAPEGFPLTDVMAEMSDFADTAALVANLDLVISVDSAMAHLAAALGKPVWVLDRFDPCWRWMTGRRDSPWYPTLRLYRQPQPGDWTSVLAELVHDLHGLVDIG